MAQKERVAPVAVITGASSGLGAVFARIAAREGYRPVLVARRQQRLEALAAEIETASGLKPWVLALDLTESAELSRLMDFLETRSVTPEIFINNAGFGDFGPMVDADEERISRMLRLNIAALTGLSIEAARAMKRLGRGRILNVASTAAFQACPGFGVYAATKAYVVSFTESLSEELRGTGVSATAFCPGPTATEFGEAAGLDESAFGRISLDKWERSAAACAEAGWAAMEAGRTVKIDGCCIGSNTAPSLGASDRRRHFSQRAAKIRCSLRSEGCRRCRRFERLLLKIELHYSVRIR